jgi:tetratricopeptide (TPR) repeat protein
MAVNSGPALARESDYYGAPVNLCARLRAAAHAGQILVGSATRELVRDHLPDEVALADLGVHRLAGIAQHTRIYQVLHHALRAGFPPLRSLDHIPNNLPFPPNPLFVGREDLLERIHAALLAEPAEPVALVGLTGLGKTQAAIEYAHRHMPEYPGGIFFLNASDTARLHLDCAAIGRFFDLPEHLTDQERANRVREELRRSPAPVLVIVDGLTDQTERRAVPQGARCRILVTCNQRHLVRHGFRLIEPPPLSEDAALRLLQSRRAACEGHELEAARATAAALGHLPLALSLVANHVDRLGIAFEEYRSMLNEAPAELLGRARRRFISDTGHDGGIFDAIALRYRSLEAPAPSVLIAACSFAGRGIAPDRLCSASGIASRADFDEAVADLVDDSLMAREEGGRLAMHSLVRMLVREMAAPDALQASLARAVVALTQCLRAANDSMDWAESRPEVAHCLVAADRCRRMLVDSRFEALLFELGRHRFYHGEHADAASCFDEAACVAETLRGPHDLGRALAIRRRGEARHRLGDRAAALRDSAEALTMAMELVAPQDPQLADYHVTVGYALRMSDRLDEALPHYEKALRILEAAHGRRHIATATCLNNLGALREAQGDLTAALALLQEALDIDTEAQGRRSPRVAIRLNNIGRVLGKLGRRHDCLQCHEEAMSINESAYGPSHPDVAGTHYHLGLAHRGLGDLDAARASFARALNIARGYFDEEHPFCRMVRDAMVGLPAEAVPQA